MKKSFLMTPLLMALVSCASQKAVTSLDPNISKMLNNYNNKLSTFENNGHNLISPTHFEEAQSDYKKAHDLAFQGKSLAEVEQMLDQGRTHFSQIEKNISLANVHLTNVLKARDEAIEEGATGTELFMEANEELAELGEEIEEKDINEVLEDRAEVLKLYNEAEINAIQERTLAKANSNLKEIYKLDGSDYFEKNVEAVEKDIASAKRLIREHKDTPDRYLQAVLKADVSSRETLAMAQTANWVENQDVKTLTTRINKDMNSILTPFSHPTPKELNYSEKVDVIRAEVDMVPLLRAELTNSQMNSYLQKRKMNKVTNKNKSLNQKLTKERALQEKVSKIQKMFDKDEAVVLIKGDDMVIRLVGLNFEFNKAKLPKDSEALLNKVAKSVKLFKKPDVIIEGHTDAVGDALYNKTLSKKRALNVNKYLVANSDLSNSDTKIVGAGFSKPLTQNKTSTGRKKNRRIDVVIDSVIN